MSPMQADAVEQRFWPKVDKSGDCWIWTAATNPQGYGYFKLGGKQKKAHRVSYEMNIGPIPEGMVVDHKCHNTSCVRPEHLRLATHKQNQENRGGVHARNVTSGVRGVYKNMAGRWVARVTHAGKIHSAGAHATIQEAEAAVIALRNSLFTHNDLDRQQQDDAA